MRVPLEWLKELVDFHLGSDALSLALTMAGLEVEGVEQVGEDTVFEVNVTPNRPDCLSILGIAREVSALLGIPLRFPEYGIEEETGEAAVRVEIGDEDLCHRYAGREVSGVTVADSPQWMKKRLEKCGMRPINNVVDVTNYVLLELGHPLHAFDRDTLKGRRIRVARTKPGGKITTLDGVERSLPDNALLIWDGERPVAVAGIMGGAQTEVKEKTKNIFLESAFFLPSSIRRSSKALGLKTESAYRFERGTDIELLEKALDRAALLMARMAGGRISERVDVYPKPFRASEIEVRYARVNRVLGTSVSAGDMTRIVERIGIKVTKGPDSFIVVPPPFRGDIQREIDVIEEIARFYGYDRIPTTVPRVQISKEAGDRHYRHVAEIRGSLMNAGYTEAINYSFMDVRMLDTLAIGKDDPRRKTLVLKNPINEEESHLRTTLVPSLIRNLLSNVSMGSRDLSLFEVSRVFTDRGGALPDEKHLLGAIYFREKFPSLWKEETPDFYIVKGVLQSLLETLKVRDYGFQPSNEPFLHPGKSCDVTVAGGKVGFLGTLHPDIVDTLSLKVSKPEIVLLEVNLDILLPSVSREVKYTPLPKFPHIERDVALIVDEAVAAAEIATLMRTYPAELIEDVSLFDFYKGKNIPEGKKSLAFTIRYRAKDRTLTDPEIEEVHSRLISYITEKVHGTVRGS